MAIFPKIEEFNRNRSFYVFKPITVMGKKFRAGDLFEKTLVTTRRLRQLYELRYLKMGPSVKEEQPERPDFSTWPEEAVKEWLSANGKGWLEHETLDKLVKRAAAEWDRRFTVSKQEATKSAARPAKEVAPLRNGNGEKPPVPEASEWPEGWEGLPWFSLQKKVFETTGKKPENKKQALEIMRSHT